jgi:hypothetical protein
VRRQEWEQEIRDRQRNIVFPDTVRNEGNFYRAALRGKTPLGPAQRFGLFLLAIPFFGGGCFGLAGAIGSFLKSPDDSARWLTLVLGGGVSAAMCAFAIAMVMRAMLVTPPPESPRQKVQGHIRVRKR